MDSNDMIMAAVRDLVKKVPKWQTRLDEIEYAFAGRGTSENAAPKWQTSVDKLHAELDAELQRRRQEERAKLEERGQTGNARLPEEPPYNRKVQILLYDVVRSISVCRHLIWKAKSRRIAQLGLMDDEIFAADQSHSSGRFCTTLEETIFAQSSVTTAIDVHTILDRSLGTVQRICVDVSFVILKNACFLKKSSIIRENLTYVLGAAANEINRAERDSLQQVQEECEADATPVPQSIKNEDATQKVNSDCPGRSLHKAMSLQKWPIMDEDDVDALLR